MYQISLCITLYIRGWTEFEKRGEGAGNGRGLHKIGGLEAVVLKTDDAVPIFHPPSFIYCPLHLKLYLATLRRAPSANLHQLYAHYLKSSSTAMIIF